MPSAAIFSSEMPMEPDMQSLPTPAARAGNVDVARTDAKELRKCLQVFQEFDTSGDGLINASELQEALYIQTGTKPSMRETRKMIGAGRSEIGFREFISVSRKSVAAKYKSKSTRNPRAYLTPQMYQQYTEIFKARAGADNMLDIKELDSFLKDYDIVVPADRLKQIMDDVDDDGSGYLEHIEFLVMLIKAMGLKRRKVGPGNCDIKELMNEGWSMPDVKKLGYSYADFEDIGFKLPELMEFFSSRELHEAGIGVAALMEQGWNCSKARDAGYELHELVNAGCTARQICVAGWADGAAAAELRRLGMPAEQLRASGWPLSELRLAGFSQADLARAGFPHEAVAAMDTALANAQKGQTRRNTFQLRKAAAR